MAPVVITAVEPEYLNLKVDRTGGAQLLIDLAHIEYCGSKTSYDGNPVVVNLMASDVENLRAALLRATMQ